MEQTDLLAEQALTLQYLQNVLRHVRQSGEEHADLQSNLGYIFSFPALGLGECARLSLIAKQEVHIGHCVHESLLEWRHLRTIIFIMHSNSKMDTLDAGLLIGITDNKSTLTSDARILSRPSYSQQKDTFENADTPLTAARWREADLRYERRGEVHAINLVVCGAVLGHQKNGVGGHCDKESGGIDHTSSLHKCPVLLPLHVVNLRPHARLGHRC